MLILVFFFNDTATPEIYTYRHTLALPDALPISSPNARAAWRDARHRARRELQPAPASIAMSGTAARHGRRSAYRRNCPVCRPSEPLPGRSEEHTSELQSLMRISYAVFCLKKKNNSKEYKAMKDHNWT